uniref:Uncharacterized protein n=1 Tax=Roseihalotalea indica TaxID=2867963 RepID=A0AA49GJY1_9BACT|nr:hypothetical protein K4G66_22260 [Tunicatimonas sp. TK19036]
MVISLKEFEGEIPDSWLYEDRAKTKHYMVPLSRGNVVKLYRGFHKDASTAMQKVVRNSDIASGGVLSRDIAAARDAIFHVYGIDPDLDTAGIVEISISPTDWDKLVATKNIVERFYYGFSRRLTSTEIRVNTATAAQIIDNSPKRLLPPGQG